MRTRRLVFVAGVAIGTVLWFVTTLAMGVPSRLGLAGAAPDRYTNFVAAVRAVNQDAGFVITKTVGLDAAQCASTSSITVPTNTTVYFCLTIVNTGAVTFTTATFSDPLLGLQDVDILSLMPAPGRQAVITDAKLNDLVQTPAFETVVTQNITNTAVITAGGDGISTTVKSANATVKIGKAAATIKKTVGLNAGVCANTTSLAVVAGTKVYYCLTIQNTGDFPLSSQLVADPRLGITYTPAAVLQPAATLVLTDGVLPALGSQPAIVDSVINTATYTGASPFGTITVNTQATVAISKIGLAITQTVGLNSTTCPTTAVTDVPYGSTIYYCLRIKNTGNSPLTHFMFEAATLGINPQALVNTTALLPGVSLEVTNANLSNFLPGIGARFTMTEVKAPITNTMIITATTADNRTDRQSAMAIVRIGGAAIGIRKYIETDASACLPNASVTLPAGTTTYTYYYCLVVENRGQVTLTQHNFTEATTGANGTFNYTLEPGKAMTITQALLNASLNAPSAKLGPFSTNASVNNILSFTSNNTEGYTNAANASAAIIIPGPTATPSHTPTPSLTPTNGPTPTPSFTPSWTPTPTPFFTATPIVVSVLAAPTATPNFLVKTVTAPVRAGQQPPSPLAQQPPSPLGQQPPSPLAQQSVSPLPDVNATAAAAALFTAQAATAAATLLTPLATQPIATPIPPTASLSQTILITATTAPTVMEVQRPPAYPTPPPSAVTLFMQIANVAIQAAGWLWFLCGSLIFFVTAGVLAGLGFRQRERGRYAIVDRDDSAYHTEVTPASASAIQIDPASLDEDHWPASLP